MFRMDNAEEVTNFFMLRLFSVLRMNAFSLIKNRNKSLMSLESAYSVEAPLVISEYISNETALDAAKSIELDMAYKLKGVIENTVFDSAIDASLVNVLGYLPIKKTQANDIAVSIPDIVGNAGEKMAIQEALSQALTVEIMQVTEANDAVIQNARGHKTYLNVEVPYITQNGEIKTTKNTIGIHVTPRRVKNIDLKTIFRDLDPQKVMKSYVKATKGEEKFIKDFLLDIKNIENIAKMNAEGSGNLLAYVRKENLRSKFNSYVYPFLFFMLDEVVTDELREELKIDLNNLSQRETYRKQLCSLGILTYNSGTDIVGIFYDGDTSIQNITMDDFVLSASKYEKEIQQLIRLNQNR